MLLYLDLAYERARKAGRLRNLNDLREAISQGAVKRIRPKCMTVFCMLMGLLPLMWAVDVGSDVMKRIAAPMIGGLVTSFMLELAVYPAIYRAWKWDFAPKSTYVRTLTPANWIDAWPKTLLADQWMLNESRNAASLLVDRPGTSAAIT